VERPGNDLLRVRDLAIWYQTTTGEARVVDGVDLDVRRNEVFGLAGESGCGKSTFVEGILRLIKPPGTIRRGSVYYYPSRKDAKCSWGIDLSRLPLPEMRPLRWREVAYIPQGAMNSLNPVMRVEEQIIDAIMEHSPATRRQARETMLARLDLVSLPSSVARMYPHELSGGMKQRVTIAAAVTLSPELLIADEPTTALDVNVQRVILQELQEIRGRLGLTIIYVSHDMAVHAEMADRMGIMYAGVIVEVGDTVGIFESPLHPYTQGLIRSIPDIAKERVRVEGIPGLAPSPLAWPTGCRFHPRCPHAAGVCRTEAPQLLRRSGGPGETDAPDAERLVACHMYSSLRGVGNV
jgi:peptide/nickel transport system ATP-binding protein